MEKDLLLDVLKFTMSMTKSSNEIQESFTLFNAFSISFFLMVMSLFKEAIYKEPHDIDNSSILINL